MFPELHLAWGGTHAIVSLHGVAVVVAVAAGAALAFRRARDRAGVLVAVAVSAVAALAGAHALFHALHAGPGGLWSGGLSSMGGIVATVATTCVMARLTRRPAVELLDVLAPAGLLALGIGRVGCFLAGCCYGVPTELPWGVVFPELGPPARHPLQLYSAAGDLGLLLFLPGPGAPPGHVTRAAAVGLGLLRAGLETLRDPAAADHLPGGMLTLAQAAALVLAAAALLGPTLVDHLHRWKPSTMAPPRRRAPEWPMRKR